MEIKIGVQDTARELAFESDDAPESVIAAYESARKSGGLLSLTDERGRTIVVPAEKIAYVEVGPASRGKVGFGAR